MVESALGSPNADSFATHFPCDTSKDCPSGHSLSSASVFLLPTNHYNLKQVY
jgi:hypothetical protein